MSRIVVLGSGGRLGAALVREWTAAGQNVVGLNRQQADLAEDAALHAALDPLEFDVLVNCAAQTNVDRCETHPEEAFRINGEAVGTVAQICAKKGARCVHISTDYVFDGAKRKPYTEGDPAEPISHYGRSKLNGETAVLSVDPRNLAVRVSWVFGPDRPSFVDQILAKARVDEQVSAIGDKWAVPTYTLDIAELLLPLVTEQRMSGVVHLCNGGACTWQEYGEWAIRCAVEAGVPMRATSVVALKMSDLTAFIARRPVYTVMSTGRLSAALAVCPRSWQEAVRDYVSKVWVRTV